MQRSFAKPLAFLFIAVICMTQLHANAIWGAAFGAMTRYDLAASVVSALVVETFVIRFLTKLPWVRAFLLTTIVNVVSFVVGLGYTFTAGMPLTLLAGPEYYSVQTIAMEVLVFFAVSATIEYYRMRLFVKKCNFFTAPQLQKSWGAFGLFYFANFLTTLFGHLFYRIHEKNSALLLDLEKIIMS